MKVLGEPFMATQMVRGSAPRCSVVCPLVDATGAGSVTGTLVPHVLPLVVTVTLVIVRPSEEVFHVSFGWHPSRVMRDVKATAMSSCFKVTMGQVVLYSILLDCCVYRGASLGKGTVTHNLVISMATTSTHICSRDNF